MHLIRTVRYDGRMDPSDLLSGLAKMLEERLGQMGYHLGILIALAAAGFIILLPIGALALIVSQLFPPSLPVSWSVEIRDIVRAVYGVSIAVVVFIILARFEATARPDIQADKV